MTRLLALLMLLLSATLAGCTYYWLLVTLEVFHGSVFAW